MKIFYDFDENQWYHSESNEESFTFGNSLALVKPMCSRLQNERELFSIEVIRQNDKLGPVVGILTGRKKDGTVFGDGNFFKRIQREMMQYSGFSYVFTPENIQEDVVHGYVFIPKDNTWVKMTVPLPNIVFNRIPNRKLERSAYYQQAFHFFKEKNIAYFNSAFMNKFDVCSLFVKNSQLAKFIPETIMIKSARGLLSFIHEHHNIYIKLARSAMGKGIFRLRLRKNRQITVEEMKCKHIYPNFSTFWQDWHTNFQKEDYIAQREIKPMLKDGKRFDFRILVHQVDDQFIPIGIGVRQAPKNHLTTHLFYGGSLLAYKTIKNPDHDQFIHDIATAAGNELQQLGEFHEFSIDAGISATGEYVIYEVNAKPMNFDELEIEEKRIKSLTNIFFSKSGFSPPFLKSLTHLYKNEDSTKNEYV